jgi:hypothetical protein
MSGAVKNLIFSCYVTLFSVFPLYHVSDRQLLVTAEIGFDSHTSPCAFCVGESDMGAQYSMDSSVFPCQLHSIIAS